MDAPKWLDRTAKAYWKRVAPSLTQSGKLNPISFDLLAAGAKAYSAYRQAVAKLDEQGRVITAHTGAVKCNPWLTVEKQAFETLARVYKELDLSGPVLPEDELDEWMMADGK